MVEPKVKPVSSLRQPQPKKKLGLTVPPALRLPHDDLIKKDESARPDNDELYNYRAEVALPTPLTPLTPPTPPTFNKSRVSVAPERDFARVANSIARVAVPSGTFAGKSKQLYDFLYAKTRGAIVPTRSVRLTKDTIMRGAHIGSERTMYKNIRRLEDSGLVRVRSIAGEQQGSEYIVMLPEEVTPLTPLTPPTHTTHTSHKVVTPLTAESGVSGATQTVDLITTSTPPKTSFKTINQDDDEVHQAVEFFETLRTAERELTGTSSRVSSYHELLEVLVAELTAAAERTEVITNMPSFLAEHLRRRFARTKSAQKIPAKQVIVVNNIEEIAPPVPADAETEAEYENARAELARVEAIEQKSAEGQDTRNSGDH